jgi:hypothetical protein
MVHTFQFGPCSLCVDQIGITFGPPIAPRQIIENKHN